MLVCFAATLPLLTAPDKRPSWAEAATAAVFGLSCLGFVMLWVRWLSWPAETALLPLLVAALWAALSRRGRLLPQAGSIDRPGLAALIALIFLLPTVIGLFLMGGGDYPAVFLHADTPFRLTHAHQFMTDRGMPPESLSNLGVRLGYHYGSPAAVAAAAVLTGLPVHSAFFAMIVLAAAGIVGVAALLAKALHGRLPFWLAFGLILVAAPTTAWHIGKAPVDWLDDPQLFFNHFPDLTVYFGIFLFLLVLHACLNLTGGRSAALALAAVVVLAGAKSSYFATAGLLVGAGAMVAAWRGREWRWLLLPLVAFAGGVGVNALTGTSATIALEIDPFFLFKAFPKRTFKYCLDILLFVLPIATYLWVARPREQLRRLEQDRLLILAITIAGLFAFLNMFGGYALGNDRELVPNIGAFEPFKMLPRLLVIVGLVILAHLWDVRRIGLNRGIAAFLAVIIALPLAHRTTHSLIMLINSEDAHEFVDNREIAEALSQIPLAQSLIATNDLRYPADNYKRDLRQMQIPALFGHQAYGINPTYERYEGASDRIAEQARLALSTWDPKVADIARAAGWTHVLVHKGAPHPNDIPLEKKFENDRYTVYAFE